ncbi:MAG: hypothetical protein OK441_03065 [Thaumarchaeota archaeon]|nr:hypothetical protein [Nitrososphaerota archaeon]
MIWHGPLMIISQLVNFDQGLEPQEFLDAAVGLFALLLFALSISAYRKTRLRRLLIVSVAFALFAVDVVVRQLDAFVFAVGPQTDQVITTAIELVILLLFFLAVVAKR